MPLKLLLKINTVLKLIVITGNGSINYCTVPLFLFIAARLKVPIRGIINQ